MLDVMVGNLSPSPVQALKARNSNNSNLFPPKPKLRSLFSSVLPHPDLLTKATLCFRRIDAHDGKQCEPSRFEQLGDWLRGDCRRQSHWHRPQMLWFWCQSQQSCYDRFLHQFAGVPGTHKSHHHYAWNLARFNIIVLLLLIIFQSYTCGIIITYLLENLNYLFDFKLIQHLMPLSIWTNKHTL